MKRKDYNYPFLEYEIKRKGVKKKAMAQVLGVDEGTLWHKTCGKRSFTVEQAIFIQKTWFPETPIEVLFQHRGGEENDTTKSNPLKKRNDTENACQQLRRNGECCQ